ncbi:hypothetical protein LCM20_06395 [Halobacillus litoralis]|uniref:hypothetical protein n=1 Tax=Halobacillus litoralis TaxID=45668 RepID=UPI001CD1F211|nr:hypothetical protein [Halobacillus litoralis]MCA0970210.1 hypothetical protein [Halobacillus litoralis]
MLLVMTVLTIILVGVSGYFTYKKRKDKGEGGSKKSWVTPFCLHLAPVVALLSYAYDGLYGAGYLLLGVLFVSAAYFSKFQPQG